MSAETTATVGTLDEFPEHTMKMARVGDHRVVIVRTASGLYALDNACPHQGYGLATGALDGDVVTCQWHNWKFDVTNGVCTLGEEDVACHTVTIANDEVSVTVRTPSDAERLEVLWPSLRRGITSDYVGQIARDTARLLAAGASPAEIMAVGVELTAAKAEDGIGHEVAMAADALAVAEAADGEARTLPLVQGLAGLAEETRDRSVDPLPTPDADVDFASAVEAEDTGRAMAWVLGVLRDDLAPEEIRARFIEVVSQHHLSYGHGIIYTQKCFELLDRVGWQQAATLLPHLARRIVYSTREDTLPYMRKAMRSIEAVDLDDLASIPGRRSPLATSTDEQLLQTLLSAELAPIDVAVEAIAARGLEGLLDHLSIAASHRLLRHDLDTELDHEQPIGWLDITHALTTARAARWAWRINPGPHAIRIGLFATWLVYDSGRNERRRGTADRPVTATLEPFQSQTVDRASVALIDAIRHGNQADAVLAALDGDRQHVSEELLQAAMLDVAGSFIVTAHLIKTAKAASEEAMTIQSNLPLAAATRFLAAPRRERFVATNVAEANAFIRTGQPPMR